MHHSPRSCLQHIGHIALIVLLAACGDDAAPAEPTGEQLCQEACDSVGADGGCASQCLYSGSPEGTARCIRERGSGYLFCIWGGSDSGSRDSGSDAPVDMSDAEVPDAEVPDAEVPDAEVPDADSGASDGGGDANDFPDAE